MSTGSFGRNIQNDIQLMKEQRQCIATLSPSGGGDTIKYLRHIVSQDPLFVKYVIAVIFVESSFRSHVVSGKNAYGLMQMTQGAILDAAKFCNLPVLQDHEMLSPENGVKYGSCYLKKLYRDLEGDWTRVLVVYNSGYLGLTRFIEAGSLTNETAEYIVKVHSALHKCSDIKEM